MTTFLAPPNKRPAAMGAFPSKQPQRPLLPVAKPKKKGIGGAIGGLLDKVRAGAAKSRLRAKMPTPVPISGNSAGPPPPQMNKPGNLATAAGIAKAAFSKPRLGTTEAARGTGSRSDPDLGNAAPRKKFNRFAPKRRDEE